MEELGYATLLVPDHVGKDESPALVALAAAASATNMIRIGTLVLNNDLRHPDLLAREAAALDRLTGGRLELGLGAGWQRSSTSSSASRSSEEAFASASSRSPFGCWTRPSEIAR
jgi:alkanesulfonate monooxygenase SsuD/methylene tetrahydromethanopterin reductase-like flavin-dependent oxidoreductase (luciferase family)